MGAVGRQEDGWEMLWERGFRSGSALPVVGMRPGLSAVCRFLATSAPGTRSWYPHYCPMACVPMRTGGCKQWRAFARARWSGTAQAHGPFNCELCRHPDFKMLCPALLRRLT